MLEEYPIKKLTLLRPEEADEQADLNGWMEWRRISGPLVLEVGEEEH